MNYIIKKHILIPIICLLSLTNIIACSSATKTSTSVNNNIKETEKNILLMEDNNFKVTYTGKDMGILGPEIKLLIENKSDKTLTLQINELSADGMMLSPVILSSQVSSGMMARDEIIIMDEDIKNLNDLKNIKGKFHICDLNDWAFKSYDVEFSLE